MADEKECGNARPYSNFCSFYGGEVVAKALCNYLGP